MYAAHLLWAFAQIRLLNNWIAGRLCCKLCAAVPTRVPREEQLMMEQFGAEYRSYVDRTGRIIPSGNR